jgi:hypothetical protein
MSTALVDVHTNRSSVAESLMSGFMDLTSDEKVVAILLRAGVTAEALIGTSWAVKRAAMSPKAVSIRQAATWMLMVIGDRKVRHEIARHVAQAREMSLKYAARDLYALARDCKRRVEMAVIVVGGQG